MSRTRLYARNLMANWVGYGANLVVMFFLTPFVIQTIGKPANGVWLVLMDLTGYLGLAEIGVRSALGRYINHYLARREPEQVNAIISTALAIFTVVGVVMLLLAAGLSLYLPSLVDSTAGAAGPGWLAGKLSGKIPGDLVPTAQVVLVLAAANLWLTLLGAAFRQVLVATERFDLNNGVDLATLGLRTVGIVAALLSGGGLVSMALVHLGTNLLGLGLSATLARRTFPQLSLRRGLVSAATFHELFSFSIWAFIGDAGMRLLYSTGNIIVLGFVNAEQVTYFGVASMLVMRSRDLVTNCSSIFVPKIMQDCTLQDWPSLRQLVRRGGSLIMATTIPLLVGLIIFGREFVVLWQNGDAKFEAAYPVLVILALSQWPTFAAYIVGPIFLGLHRVRLGAVLTLTQGLLNLGLTIGLLLFWQRSIVAVAWGTFWPRVVFAVITGAIALRWIGYNWGRFAVENLLRWLAISAGFALVCWGLTLVPWLNQGAAGGRYWQWVHFGIKVGIAAAAYLPLAWLMLLTAEDRLRAKGALSRLMTRKPAEAETK